MAGSRRSALRVRDFRVFWTGALLSNTGTWLQSLTVPYVLFQLTNSALWVGLAAVAQFLPMVLLSPLGGTLADRVPRRSILLVTQSAMAGVALLMLVTWLAGVRSPGMLLGLVAIGGALNGVNMPSWQSYVSDLVPREDLMSAVTLNSLQFNASRAVGPAIAGIVLAVLGPAWAFAINALSFAAVIVALVMVRTRPVTRPRVAGRSAVRDYAEAVAYTRRQPFLLLTLCISGLLGGLGNPVFGFTVVFAGVVYLVGPMALGFLNVAPGVGAVAIAPYLTRRAGGSALSDTVRWALPLYGAAILVFGAWPSYAVGMVTLVVVGATFLAVISSINSSLQLFVDEQFRGRVMSLRLISFTLSVSVGSFIQGWVADRIGPRPTVMIAGCLLLVAAAVLLRLRGRFSLSRLDGPRPSPAVADRSS